MKEYSSSKIGVTRRLNASLLINGDADVITPEHTVEMFRLIPKCWLAILPGTHGAYMGEITTLKNGSRDPVVAIIKEFLESHDKLKKH